MNALTALFAALNIVWSISGVAQFNSLDLVTGALERTIRDNLQCWDNPLRHRCFNQEKHSLVGSILKIIHGCLRIIQDRAPPCLIRQQRLAKMDQQFVQLEFICPQDRVTSWHHRPEN